MPQHSDQQIGLWMTGALVVGSMIGAGIFMLPVSLAPLGLNTVIGWVASIFGALCIAFALARLSRLGGEGIQANIERQLGRHAAFLVAWAFWVSNWAAQAVLAIATASALSWIDPRFSGPGFVIPVAIFCVLVLTLVNALGARASGGMSILTVAIKILPLAAVILILALRGASGGAYEPFAPTPITAAGIATAAALTFFALTGFENATTLVCKVRDPERTVPLAIIGGTSLVAIVYLLASSGVQLLVPADLVTRSPAPFADAISAEWGGGVASFAALAVAIAAFGALNGMMLATGELGYAMGLRRDLPAFMAKARADGTPIGAQLVSSALTIALILANSSRGTSALFTFILLLSTASVLVVYLAGSLSAWRLTASLAARALVLIALAFIAFAAWGTGWEPLLWCVVLLAAGLVVRTVMHSVNKRAAGASKAP